MKNAILPTQFKYSSYINATIAVTSDILPLSGPKKPDNLTIKKQEERFNKSMETSKIVVALQLHYRKVTYISGVGVKAEC